MKRVYIFLVFFSLLSFLSFSDNKIFISPETDDLKKIGENFSFYLEKITGKRFIISSGKYKKNMIFLGLTKNCKNFSIPSSLENKGLEAVYIKSDRNSIVIIGNSPVAIRHGTYIYLYKLGCRWFFPGKRWTIIPKRKSIYVNYETLQEPDFKNRRIWYGYGTGAGEKWKSKEVGNNYKIWAEANLQGGIATFHCGHSWGDIVRKNKEEFKKHPEYFALKEDGKARYDSGNVKFCCSNPGLLELVAKDRKKLLQEYKKKNLYEFMVSVDPSDGHGYCHCKNCEELGNSTDRVIYLANYVAKKLREVYPDGWVGLYAYSDHQIPPTIKVEPNVYVQIAMGFNKTGYTYDELINLWGKKAGAIGIREYYGVMAWDWDLHGRGREGSINYHKDKIPYWKKCGATSISAEITGGWGWKGPGEYIAAKLMWDVNSDVNELFEDFFEKAFGKAKEEMKKFFKIWDGNPTITNGKIYKSLECFKIASEKKKEKNVQARLNDLKAYIHYVILYNDSQNSKRGKDAREKFFNLMEYTYRIKTRSMVHSYALARRIANYKFPSNLFSELPEGEQGKGKRKNIIEKWWIFNPECEWQKNKEEMTDEEVENLFKNDLKRFEKYKDEMVEYSKNFICISLDKIQGVKEGDSENFSFRFKNTFYILFENKKVPVEVEGVRNSIVSLYSMDGRQIGEWTVKKNENKKITLTVKEMGIYKIVFNEWYKLKFPDNLKFVGEVSSQSPLRQQPYAGPLYFYVPKGTKYINAYYETRLIIKSPDGKVIKYLPDKSPSPVKIKVENRNDGKVWCVEWLTAGKFFFTNIPPYCSFSDKFIFLPKKKKKKDNL